jgi:hypothetical protein
LSRWSNIGETVKPDLLTANAHVIGSLGVIHEIVSGPRDWTSLDSLQVLTKWLNVTPKAADAVQLDLGARKG